MANEKETFREEFETEPEAAAFVRGIEFDSDSNDHLFAESPYPEEGAWVVEVTRFC